MMASTSVVDGAGTRNTLSGLRVMIVEDEMLVALLIE